MRRLLLLAATVLLGGVLGAFGDGLERAGHAQMLWSQPIERGTSGGDSSSTWNPADAASGMTFSGGNLTATSGTTTSTYYGVRSTPTTYTTGKIYFEVMVGSAFGTSLNPFDAGIANASASLTTFGGSDDNSVVLFGNGSAGSTQNDWLTNNTNDTTHSGQCTIVANAVIGFAFDIGGQLAWCTLDGTHWNTGAADPAAATGGFPFPSIAAGP